MDNIPSEALQFFRVVRLEERGSWLCMSTMEKGGTLSTCNEASFFYLFYSILQSIFNFHLNCSLRTLEREFLAEHAALPRPLWIAPCPWTLQILVFGINKKRLDGYIGI